MSDAEVWSFKGAAAAKRIHSPFLIVQAKDDMDDVAQEAFAMVPTKDKRYVTDPAIDHLRYYDDAEVIDASVAQVAKWFREHS